MMDAVPVKSSPPTYKQSIFYRLDASPVIQITGHSTGVIGHLIIMAMKVCNTE